MSNKLNNIADLAVEVQQKKTIDDVETFKNFVSLLLRSHALSLSKKFDQVRWDNYIAKKTEERNPTIQKKICIICSKEYFGLGANAEPIKNGQCCDGCDKSIVVPTRIANVMS